MPARDPMLRFPRPLGAAQPAAADPIAQLAAAVDRFSGALAGLTLAVQQQTEAFEVIRETIPAVREAELLGLSEKTVRKRREERRAARLLIPTR